MLIHKETMGVLEYIWTGQFRRGADGLSEPVNRPAKLAELPELDPAQWWELSGSHPLARKILKHYPWLTPVVGEQGELLDVEVVPDAAQQARLMRETARSEAMTREAASRGYRRRRGLRPRNLMPFLSGATGVSETAASKPAPGAGKRIQSKS